MSVNQVKSLGRFFREVRGEFQKVVWPARAEFVGSTIVVLVVMCFFAVYLGVVDLCLGWLVRQFFSGVFGI